ncbi:MAG TPA: DUF1254 domain-containing protein [Gaiellaceae bacterium]
MSNPVPVTPDNFIRAETDRYFGMFVDRGALGSFFHHRDLPPIDLPGVRPNRDTLYSEVVFDLDAGPATVTLPDPDDRFLSFIVIDQDHYVFKVAYGAGSHELTRGEAGTRYVFAAVRMLFDPSSPADLETVHALQDALRIEQASRGTFDVPAWDEASQTKVRKALLELSSTLPDLRNGGGRRDEVDPVRHLIATASGWGLNPDKDAIYLNVTPPNDDGSGAYELTVGEVPVDGFWSISVYDAEGHFVENNRAAYTLNDITAAKNPDGSVTIRFGGDDDQPNCLPIFPGWNYMVRLYRPRPEVLDGRWTFPSLEAA